MPSKTAHIRVGIAVVAVLGALLLAEAPVGAAQRHKQAKPPVKVVAHLPLPGMHVNQMFMQQRGEDYFLYLHRPNKQAFALVNVTNPNKPVLLEGATLKQDPGAHVEMMKSEAALAVSVVPEPPTGPGGGQGPPATAPPAVTLPTDTVRLIDLSDPKNPKIIQTFTGVTSMLPDDSRRLLFIANSEGLWIVSHPELNILAPCDSTAALMVEPHCQ